MCRHGPGEEQDESSCVRVHMHIQRERAHAQESARSARKRKSARALPGARACEREHNKEHVCARKGERERESARTHTHTSEMFVERHRGNCFDLVSSVFCLTSLPARSTPIRCATRCATGGALTQTRPKQDNLRTRNGAVPPCPPPRLVLLPLRRRSRVCCPRRGAPGGSERSRDGCGTNGFGPSPRHPGAAAQTWSAGTRTVVRASARARVPLVAPSSRTCLLPCLRANSPAVTCPFLSEHQFTPGLLGPDFVHQISLCFLVALPLHW